MTTMTITQPAALKQEGSTKRFTEPVQFALDHGFGCDLTQQALTPSEEKVRVLLTNCGRCWGVS